MCLGLCSITSKKGCQVVRSDALHLPFREGADAVICIAVLHHMSSQSRRQKLISEIVRVCTLFIVRCRLRFCDQAAELVLQFGQWIKVIRNMQKCEIIRYEYL